MAPVRLPADLLAMLARGVSTIVASHDAALRPSLMRAVGSEVAADGSRVTVWLARSQSRQLLQDIASTGQLAVVFSEPSTHRTVQLKARSATQRAALSSDQPLLARYLAAMRRELDGAGYDGATIAPAMLAHRLEDLVAVSFVPEEAFDQTPGPRAGASLGGAP
jgi:hypothetical protein